MMDNRRRRWNAAITALGGPLVLAVAASSIAVIKSDFDWPDLYGTASVSLQTASTETQSTSSLRPENERGAPNQQMVTEPPELGVDEAPWIGDTSETWTAFYGLPSYSTEDGDCWYLRRLEQRFSNRIPERTNLPPDDRLCVNISSGMVEAILATLGSQALLTTATRGTLEHCFPVIEGAEGALPLALVTVVTFWRDEQGSLWATTLVDREAFVTFPFDDNIELVDLACQQWF